MTLREERLNVLKFHGLYRRYFNLVDQHSLMAGSTLFKSVYTDKKEYLEQADFICSFGSVTRSLGGVLTIVTGRRVKAEVYSFLGAAESCKTMYDLRSLATAVHHWAPDTFHREKAVFVTNNDEIQALMNQEELNADIIDREMKEIVGNIKDTLANNHVHYVVISVTENEIIPWASEYNDSVECQNKLDEFAKQVVDIDLTLKTVRPNRHHDA